MRMESTTVRRPSNRPPPCGHVTTDTPRSPRCPVQRKSPSPADERPRPRGCWTPLDARILIDLLKFFGTRGAPLIMSHKGTFGGSGRLGPWPSFSDVRIDEFDPAARPPDGVEEGMAQGQVGGDRGGQGEARTMKVLRVPQAFHLHDLEAVEVE